MPIGIQKENNMKPLEIILIIITGIAVMLFIIKAMIPAIIAMFNKDEKPQKHILIWMLCTFAIMALALILYP